MRGEANAEIEKLLSEAGRKRAIRWFEPALQLVQRALEIDPSNRSAQALQRALLDEQQRDRDRRMIATELQRSQLLSRRGELEKARLVVEELAAIYPDDPGVAQARHEINEKVRLDGEGQHGAENTTEVFGNRATPARNLRELNFVLSARRRMRNGDLDGARQLVTEGRARFPDSQELLEIEDEIEKGGAEAERHVRSTKLRAQIEKIERSLSDFPDPSLNSLNKELNRQGLPEAIHAVKPPDEEQIRPDSQEAEPKPTEPRAMELPDWRARSIIPAPEFRRERRRRPLVISGVIGVVAAAVVVAAIVGLPPPPPPPASITVQPAEIIFFYSRGGTVPKPRSFQIITGKNDQRWTTESSDPWVQFSKADGVGTSDLDVSVDPATLSPGEHESIATVESASFQRTLIVRLRITEPPESSVPPPPREIKIEPSKLEFSYQRKGPPPAPERFRIGTVPAGQGWTATEEGNWLVLSRHTGSGTSEIDVSVDPSKVETGDHTGIVKVTSGAAVNALEVLLHVTEPKLQLDPPVNCHGDQYNGRYTGTITWLGPLNDGDVLTISNKNVASAGRAIGRELPGCPVSITPVPELDITEPSAATNYRQILITNKSGHAIDQIRITWNVRK